MPLILGTNSIKDTGYNVDNSLRFNDGSTDYLSKTFSGTQTNTSNPTTSSHLAPPKIEGSRNAHDQPASFLESGDPWAARRREIPIPREAMPHRMAQKYEA